MDAPHVFRQGARGCRAKQAQGGVLDVNGAAPDPVEFIRIISVPRGHEKRFRVDLVLMIQMPQEKNHFVAMRHHADRIGREHDAKLFIRSMVRNVAALFGLGRLIDRGGIL
jgi:hypothetical protein